MKPFRDETELAAALRELRPEPWPEFAAKLDARAAAGFPSESGWRAALASLRERISSTPPRRLIAPAGAFAVAAVVDRHRRRRDDRIRRNQASPESNVLGFLNKSVEAPLPSAAEEAGPVQKDAPTSAGGEGSAGVQFAPAPGSSRAIEEITRASKPASGPYASQAGRREIERSAEMVLATDPDQIRAATGKVFDAVHAAEGIVLRSSVRDGEAPVSDFELLIPSDNLGDALASFSRIAEVRSRNEATQDITAPIVSVGERLQDARATVQSLLGELADADTGEERAAVEAELRSERYRVAALRSRLSSLERRANFSRVSLRIETGSAPAAEEDGGAWGVADGVEGAGRILAVAAGVTVIGLAILAPLALIALLAWLGRHAWLRRARRGALSRA